MATVVQKYRFYTCRSTKLITRRLVKWFLRLYERCKMSAFVVSKLVFPIIQTSFGSVWEGVTLNKRAIVLS